MTAASPPQITLTILGTGAGATAVYHGEPSSACVLSVDGQPELLMDVGLGVVRQCLQHAGGELPPSVYVSHNHSDHAGELSVMLAVESMRGRRRRVYAHLDVMQRLQRHRLHELHSTGKSMDELAEWVPCPEGQNVPLQSGTPRDSGAECLERTSGALTMRTVRTRHSELCYGLVVSWQGRPVLGWTADSGWDEALFQELSQAPTLLVDARAKGTPEHAGFDDVARLAKRLVPQGKRVYITGYGCQHEAPPKDMDLGGAQVARPGQRLDLTPAAEPVAGRVLDRADLPAEALVCA